MITTYELKNRPCCRLFYNVPYFMKNLFLLIGLLLIMVPIYIVNFRAETAGNTNVFKLIAGLNSKTFNYLEKNASNDLNVKRSIKSQAVTGLTSQIFYSECVAYSRPCHIPFMANAWQASKELPYEMKAYANLATELKKCKVRVQIDPMATSDLDSPSSDSFASN